MIPYHKLRPVPDRFKKACDLVKMVCTMADKTNEDRKEKEKIK